MARSRPNPDELLPLTAAVFHVLLALVDQERHGYAIMSEVTERTDGQIKLGPGTLYGTIRRLLEGALIEESEERPDAELDDERRRYYRLTDFGRQVIQAEVQRYAKMVKIARASGLLASRLLSGAEVSA